MTTTSKWIYLKWVSIELEIFKMGWKLFDGKIPSQSPNPTLRDLGVNPQTSLSGPLGSSSQGRGFHPWALRERGRWTSGDKQLRAGGKPGLQSTWYSPFSPQDILQAHQLPLFCFLLGEFICTLFVFIKAAGMSALEI